jgi:hypothetical protein
MPLCSKSCCEGIDLLLELSNSTIRLLLTFTTRCSDYTLPSGLCASFAGIGAVDFVELALDFQTAACLAGARPFDVIGIGGIAFRTLLFSWAVCCRRLLVHSQSASVSKKCGAIGAAGGRVRRRWLNFCNAATISLEQSPFTAHKFRDLPDSNSG